jgi:hypothetical protein
LAHRQPRGIGEAPGSRNDGGLAGRAAAQLALHRAQRQQPQPDARATSKPLNLGSLPNSHEIAIDFQELDMGQVQQQKRQTVLIVEDDAYYAA